MKRFLVGIGLALTLGVLSGFSLFEAAVQTQRVRWTAFFSGTVAPNTVLGPFFGGTSVPDGTVNYGPATWRAGGISCQLSGTGTSLDGGTTMIVNVEREDAGIEGQCDLGVGSCSSIGSFDCHFSVGMSELGNAANGGNLWHMRSNATNACSYSSGTIFCATDLFR